jgi:hypothetical protein
MTVRSNLRRQGRLYVLLLPLAALAAFVSMVLLWTIGLKSVAVAVLQALGVEAGPVPFVDLHAVLAAAECQRQGLDVYLSNPCDVFRRPHIYSPLWLTAVPPMLGTAATPWVGSALVFIFILVLPLLMRPRSARDVAIFAIALFSPMTLYLLERANTDLVIFLLVLGAGLLYPGSPRQRFASYAILVGAALLKYYPAVLLALAARERLRDVLLIATGAIAALALFVACCHTEFNKALANMAQVSAQLSFYTDAFSARNLPYGIATGLPGLPAAPVAMTLLAILLIVALARIGRTAVLLEAGHGVRWTSEMNFAVIGSLLVVGVFFAVQNVNYRGTHLLFVLPGLLQWRDETSSAAIRRFLSCMVGAVLFVMWNEFFRRGLLAAFDAQPSDRIAMMFWVVRELVWWWLICGLAAIALCYFVQLQLVRDGAAWVDRFWPALGRKLQPVFKTDQSAGG